MSSRFVSGGITDTETGDVVPTNTSHPTSSSSSKKEEWAMVQTQIEEERRRRQQQKEALQTGAEEKSLYDVLQANKAAKQAAFEEANKIKNQFRALDEDEIEFLDGVRERQRREEERVRRETEEGLRGFRELQQRVSAGEGPEASLETGGEGGSAGAGGSWSVGRKRKRRKDGSEGVLKGLKRRSSGGADGDDGKAEEKSDDVGKGKPIVDNLAHEEHSTAAAKDAQVTQGLPAKPAPPLAARPMATLVDYGSDDESD